MADSFTIQAILEAQDRMSSVFSSVSSQAKNMGSSLGNTLTNSSSGFNRFNSTVGTALTGVGAATTAMGVTSVKSFGQFQQSLNTAAVVAGGTSQDISRLSDVANKMGADLPLSAQDCADAMIEMARNGASLEDIEKTFPAIAQAATGAGEDIQTTAGVVQQAMNIWGNSLESPEQAAAILVQTANASNASIGSMQQALATIGGTATQAGVNMQDASTAIGLLTNKGFSAAQASQDLNHAMLQMAAPSKKAKKQMDALGISYTDAGGKMKPFKQILNEVADATNGMGDAQKMAALKTMFGTAGMQAILPLLGAVKDESGDVKTSWDAFSKSIDDAAGNTEKATNTLKTNADEMQKNVGAKVEQVGGNWESLRNKSMEAESGVTSSMLDMINNGLEWAATSDSNVAQVARSFIGLSPVIGPAMTAVGGFMMNFSKIAGGVGSVAKVAGGAIKGIGTMAVGAGKGVVSLTGKLFGNKSATSSSSKASSELKSNYQKTGTAASNSSKGVSTMGNSIGNTVGNAKSGAISMAGMALQTLAVGAAVGIAAAGLGVLVNAIANLAKTGTDGVVAMATFAITVGSLAGIFALLAPALTAGSAGLIAFGGAVLSAGAGVALFGAGIAAINLSLTALVVAVTGLINALNSFNMTGTQVVSVLGSIGTGFAMMIANFVLGITTTIPMVAASFVMMIMSMLTTLAGAMPQMMAKGVQIIVSFINGITQGLPQIMAAGFNLIMTFLQALTVQLPALITAGANLIVSVLQGIAQNLPKIVKAGADVVVNFLTELGKQLPRIIEKGMEMIAKVLEGIAKNLPRLIDAAVDVIVSFIDGIARNLPRIIASGVNLLLKFIDGILQQIPQITAKAGEVVLTFVEGVGAALGSIFGAGTQLLDRFVKGIKDGFNKARSAGKGASDSAKDGGKSVDFKSLGSDIISGIINGIKNAAGRLMDSMANIAKSALNKAKKMLGIHSPSRVMRDEVGRFIPAGIAVGIDKNLSTIEKATQSMTDAITPNLPNFNELKPQIKALNNTTSDALQQNLTNNFDIERQPIDLKVSIGGEDFKRFSQKVDTTNTKVNRISRAYSI